MVFDTELSTIERWDGFKWVTQAGTGALGISGAGGDYTYYSDYNTAIAAASSGDTIEQFGNIIETGAVAVDITKNLTIQMNGYSYTLDNAGTDRAFTVTGLSLTDIKILNGTINRINGTGGGALALNQNTTTKPTISLEGTTLYCDLAGNQTLLYVNSNYTVIGGLFKGPGDLLLDTDSTLTNFVYNGEGSVRAFRTGVMISNGYIFSTSDGLVVSDGAGASNITAKCTGIAINNAGNISNCEGYSIGSAGCYSSGTTGKFVNCYAESGLDTTNGHAFEMASGQAKFINCTGKVKNSGAYGIKGSSATASILNFSGIGMTSLFDGVTNAQIETTDAYGNVLVV